MKKTPQLKPFQSLFPRNCVLLNMGSEDGGRKTLQGILGLRMIVSASNQL